MTTEERFEAWAERYSRGVHPVTAKSVWLACEAARDAEIERVAEALRRRKALGVGRQHHAAELWEEAESLVRALLSAQLKECE